MKTENPAHSGPELKCQSITELKGEGQMERRGQRDGKGLNKEEEGRKRDDEEEGGWEERDTQGERRGGKKKG